MTEDNVTPIPSSEVTGDEAATEALDAQNQNSAKLDDIAKTYQEKLNAVLELKELTDHPGWDRIRLILAAYIKEFSGTIKNTEQSDLVRFKKLLKFLEEDLLSKIQQPVGDLKDFIAENKDSLFSTEITQESDYSWSSTACKVAEKPIKKPTSKKGKK